MDNTMDNTIKIEGKSLTVGGKTITFDYRIEDHLVAYGMIYVLLAIPLRDDTIDNIYAVSFEGEIVWRVESLKLVAPTLMNYRYEYLDLSDDGMLLGTDFYGKRYHINPKDGKIMGRDFVK